MGKPDIGAHRRTPAEQQKSGTEAIVTSVPLKDYFLKILDSLLIRKFQQQF